MIVNIVRLLLIVVLALGSQSASGLLRGAVNPFAALAIGAGGGYIIGG